MLSERNGNGKGKRRRRREKGEGRREKENGIPLLGQEGWLRIKEYREATFESADGVVSPE